MEKKAPNLLNNLKNDGLKLQKKSVLAYNYLFYIVMMLNCITINAQNFDVNSDTPQVMEVKSYITSLKQSEQTSRSRNLKSVHLEHLISDVQPTIYITSSEVKTFGEHPNSLIIDSSFLSNLSISEITNNDVEIITIKIKTKSDLKRPIDLSLFSNYPKLKYIYIISTIQTNENTIIQLIKNTSLQYGVFYKIDTES